MLQHAFPVPCWMFKKVKHVNVEHQDYSHHCRKSGKAPAPFKAALHKGQEKVRDEGYPDLGLDGVLAHPIEVAQGKVLLKLLEKRFDLPAPLIDGDNFIHAEVVAVCQQLDLLLLAPSPRSLGLGVRDNPGPMRCSALVEHDVPDRPVPVPAIVEQDALRDRLVGQVSFHLGHVGNAMLRQILQLFIVDVGAVHGEHVAVVKVAWLEHEAVVGGRGSKLDVAGNPLVRADDCMDLYAAFLLSNFRVPADTPENQVGEQRHRCGIDDFEPSQPSGQPVEAAVR